MKLSSLGLALVFALSAAGSVAAQSLDKEQSHLRLIDLQGQLDAAKGTPQYAALAAEFAQISASLGGDLPCAVGPSGNASAEGSGVAIPAGCVASAGTFTSTAPVAIPTGPAVVTSTVTVSGAGSYLWDVNLRTFIEHTFAADLDITVTSPAGTVVTLTTDNGAGNDNVFNGTVWDDDANPAGAVPYTNNNGLVTDHAYANNVLASPLVPEEALAAFNGENPNGTWTITISDDLAGDGGTLTSWNLDLITFAGPVVANAVQSFNQATPVPIADVAVSSSTLAVSGLQGGVCKAVLRGNITHTFSADMDITLTSPNGTIVTVGTDNGAGNDNVYAGTTFDDDANPGGTLPYTTNAGLVTDHPYANLTVATPLVVEESMGAFIGENGNGTWTLTVSDDLAGDSGTINNWGLDLVTCSCQADLAMTLTDSPDPVTAGTQLTYTATVANNGPSAAADVSFSLPLPAGTSFVSATPSAGGVCTNVSPVTCSFAGATAPTTSRSATIVVAVAANVANGTNLSATATASSVTTDPNAGNNEATATTAVQTQADIAMTAFTDSPDPVAAGTNLTYQVAMINNGPSDAQNARFSLPLPAGTSFVSATPSAGGNCTNVSPVTCTWAGATAPTTSRSATIVVLVGASVLQGTTLNALVTGASDTNDLVSGNNSLSTSTLVNAVADLQIGLTASVPQSDLGQTVTFTATSTNLGPSDAQNVVVSITLSPDFRYGSFSASAGATCTTPQIGNSGVISCTWAGATAPGVVRTLAVNAASFTPGTSSIQAATSSATTDPVPQSNNVASVSVLVGNPIEPIPTLSQWGLVLLGLLVGLIGVAMVRRD